MVPPGLSVCCLTRSPGPVRRTSRVPEPSCFWISHSSCLPPNSKEKLLGTCPSKLSSSSPTLHVPENPVPASPSRLSVISRSEPPPSVLSLLFLVASMRASWSVVVSSAEPLCVSSLPPQPAAKTTEASRAMSKALMFGPALFLLLEGWRVSSAACNTASFRTAGKVDPTPPCNRLRSGRSRSFVRVGSVAGDLSRRLPFFLRCGRLSGRVRSRTLSLAALAQPQSYFWWLKFILLEDAPPRLVR